MRIGIAADHGGFSMKEHLKTFLQEQGHEVVDFGTASHDTVDYPRVIAPLAKSVSNGDLERGVVICGTGIGASIVANRFPGNRCALCHEPLSAEFSRRHNDANVLALGARLIGKEMATRILWIWLTTEFDGGRHARRLRQIDALRRDGSDSEEARGDSYSQDG